MSAQFFSANNYLVVKAFLDLAVGLLVFRFTRSKSKLTYYISHTPWIQVNWPPPAGQGAMVPAAQNTYLGAGTLFLWNGGKLAAQKVEIGHYGALPLYGILPNVQRNIIALPGGATVIEFPHVPPRTLITISYLFFLPATGVQDLISYVRSQDGPAQRIPVALMRVFPKWLVALLLLSALVGLWVLTDKLWQLGGYLWGVYQR